MIEKDISRREFLMGSAAAPTMIHEEVMAEASSFMKSRVILTAAEIDLFTHLEQKPSNADEISR